MWKPDRNNDEEESDNSGYTSGESFQSNGTSSGSYQQTGQNRVNSPTGSRIISLMKGMFINEWELPSASFQQSSSAQQSSASAQAWSVVQQPSSFLYRLSCSKHLLPLLLIILAFMMYIRFGAWMARRRSWRDISREAKTKVKRQKSNRILLGLSCSLRQQTIFSPNSDTCYIAIYWINWQCWLGSIFRVQPPWTLLSRILE